MIVNRPKGISINKNALNIQANQQPPPQRTPSPPKLKSLPNTKQSLNIHQNQTQTHLHQLEPLIPLQELKQEQQLKQQLQYLKDTQHQPLKQQQQQPEQPPPILPQPQSENDGLVVGPIVRQQSRIPRLVEVEEEIEDIDKSTSRDAIFLVCDLAKDIYNYMYELEEAQSIKQDYLKDQKILTPRVRQRLVNWCIDIHSQLKLLPETLYMTIAVIDRFFDRVTVKQQSQVQLVAVGATLIASKYEEIYPPDVGDLIYLTQNAYSRRDIMRIEIEILEQLNFDLGKPIPLAFLRRFSKAAHCDLKMHSIAKFLMEISLTEYECAHWKPSLLAAAALFTTIHLVHQQDNDSANKYSTTSTTTTNSIAGFGLSRRLAFTSSLSSSSTTVKSLSSSSSPTTVQDRWNKSLVHYTHYTRRQLQEPSATLCRILKRVLKSPQSYNSAKKNMQNLPKWPELKSTRVDELIKLGDQMST